MRMDNFLPVLGILVKKLVPFDMRTLTKRPYITLDTQKVQSD